MDNIHKRSLTPPIHEEPIQPDPIIEDEDNEPKSAPLNQPNVVSALKQTKLPKHSRRPMTSAVPIVKEKKRNNLTLQDKIIILDWMATEKKGQSETARHFQKHGFPTVTQSSISRWSKEETKLRMQTKDTTQLSFKRARVVENPLMEASLKAWCLQKLSKGIKLTGDVIRAKARDFETLHNPDILDEDRMSFSSGWLDRFKQRMDLKEYKSHGEAGSVIQTNVDVAIRRHRILTDKFHPDNIFNFDETGLNYRNPPSRGLAQQQSSGLKGDKTRLTFGFCINASGTERLEPLIIGHSKKLRCFKRKSGQELGFLYYWNKKAWMTGSIFAE